MFIQCYYVSNAEVSQWKEKRVNSCIKTWIWRIIAGSSTKFASITQIQHWIIFNLCKVKHLPLKSCVLKYLIYILCSYRFSFQIYNYLYGKNLILPAQGTNSKDGIGALTITTINFIMVLPTPLRRNLLYLAFDWLSRCACLKVNQNKELKKFLFPFQS